MAKRKIVPLEELGKAFEIIEAARKSPPVVFVVTASSFLENALGSLLEKVLFDCDERPQILSGPLSFAATRADMCYCMGLIPDKIRFNAKKIFAVRNKFAHSHLQIDFQDKAVKEICNEFHIDSVVGYDGAVIPPEKIIIGRKMDAREKFTLAFWSAYSEIVMAAATNKQNPPPQPSGYKLIINPGKELFVQPMFNLPA